MNRYRVVLKDEIILETNSLYKAMEIISKNSDNEDYILQQDYDDHWDEWLDQDGLNAHEHLHSYGNNLSHLKDDEDEDEEKDIDVSTYEDEDEQESGLSQKEEMMKHLSEEEIVEDDRFLDIIGKEDDGEETKELKGILDNLEEEELGEDNDLDNDDDEEELNNEEI